MKSNTDTTATNLRDDSVVCSRSVPSFSTLPDADGRISLVKLQLRGMRHTVSQLSAPSRTATTSTSRTQEDKHARLCAILEEALRVGGPDFGGDDN